MDGELLSEEFIIKEEFCVQLADDGLFTFRNAFLKLSDKKAYNTGFKQKIIINTQKILKYDYKYLDLHMNSCRPVRVTQPAW